MFTVYKSNPLKIDEIEQKKLNITEKSRSNLFKWNGQFSPQLIEYLLSEYSKTHE